MKKILLYLSSKLFLVLVLLTACKKERAVKPPPPTDKYQVVNTGTLNYTGVNLYEPVYWIDGDRFALDLDGSTQGFPYGIEKRGNDIFIAGAYEGIHPLSGNRVLLPCYWKNGRKINLPVNSLSFDQRCGASDMKWYKDALYILGDAELLPVLWKVKAGGETEIIHLPTDTTVTGMRKGGNLEIYNDRMYFACSEKRETAGQSLYTVGYWMISGNDRPSFHQLQQDLAYALAFGISVSASGIFITGEYATAQTASPSPVIWTLAGHHPVSGQIDTRYQRLNEVCSDGLDNLYINLMDIRDYQPVAWKLAIKENIYLPVKPQVPADARGFCHSLASIDYKMAFTYLYTLPAGEHFAATIFDGRTIRLDLNNSSSIFLHSTRVFKVL